MRVHDVFRCLRGVLPDRIDLGMITEPRLDRSAMSASTTWFGSISRAERSGATRATTTATAAPTIAAGYHPQPILIVCSVGCVVVEGSVPTISSSPGSSAGVLLACLLRRCEHDDEAVRVGRKVGSLDDRLAVLHLNGSGVVGDDDVDAVPRVAHRGNLPVYDAAQISVSA